MLSFFQMIGGYLWMAADWAEHHTGVFMLVIATTSVAQWRQSRKSSERQLRAYVHLTSASVKTLGETLSALLTINNGGQTPAYNMRTSYAFRSGADSPMAPLSEHEVFDQKMILAPHADYPLRLSIKSPENPLAQGERAPLFVVTRVEYCDAFKRKRWTNIRCEIVRGPDGYQIRPCREGNDAN